MFTLTAEQARKETVHPSNFPGYAKDLKKIETAILSRCQQGCSHATITLENPMWVEGYIAILQSKGFSAGAEGFPVEQINVYWD